MSTPTIQCSMGHPMQTQSCTDACVLCRDAVAAMQCAECQDKVCDKCLSVYNDVGFAMFLGNKDHTLLPVYAKTPECTVTRFRNPWSIAVYNLRQEFDNTSEHHCLLEDHIKYAEKGVLQLKHKLSAGSSEMRCAPHHTLQAGGSDECKGFCILCCDISHSKPAAAVHCLECHETVCEKCLPLFKDTRFALFLAQESRSSLFAYQQEDTVGNTELYELHQEFNGTAEHREILNGKIANAEKRVEELKLKLAEAQAARVRGF